MKTTHLTLRRNSADIKQHYNVVFNQLFYWVLTLKVLKR